MNDTTGIYIRRSPKEIPPDKAPEEFCIQQFLEQFGEVDATASVEYYADCCERLELIRCPQMLKLLRDCVDGRVNLVISETKFRITKNIPNLIFWLDFLLHLENKVDVLVYDFVDTSTSAEAREQLITSTEHFVSHFAEEYEQWKARLLDAIAKQKETK